MQEGRSFRIVYYLLDKGQATPPELAEKFEVSVRTIYRDVDALSGAGIPIYAETGRNGGIHLMHNFVLDKAVLPEQEKLEILTALQSINTAQNVGNGQTLQKLPHCFILIRKIGLKWIFPDGETKNLTMKNSNCRNRLSSIVKASGFITQARTGKYAKESCNHAGFPTRRTHGI